MKELINKVVKLNELDATLNPDHPEIEVTITKVFDAVNVAGVFVQTEKSEKSDTGYYLNYAKAARLAVK